LGPGLGPTAGDARRLAGRSKCCSPNAGVPLAGKAPNVGHDCRTAGHGQTSQSFFSCLGAAKARFGLADRGRALAQEWRGGALSDALRSFCISRGLFRMEVPKGLSTKPQPRPDPKIVLSRSTTLAYFETRGSRLSLLEKTRPVEASRFTLTSGRPPIAKASGGWRAVRHDDPTRMQGSIAKRRWRRSRPARAVESGAKPSHHLSLRAGINRPPARSDGRLMTAVSLPGRRTLVQQAEEIVPPAHREGPVAGTPFSRFR